MLDLKFNKQAQQNKRNEKTEDFFTNDQTVECYILQYNELHLNTPKTDWEKVTKKLESHIEVFDTPLGMES